MNKGIIETLEAEFSKAIVEATGDLAVAKAATKTLFLTKICSELDKAGVIDISCDAYKTKELQ